MSYAKETSYAKQTDSPTAFSESSAERPAASTFEKFQTLSKESRQRSQRVSKILKAALSETLSEVREGRTAIAPLAKEVTSETVAAVREKSQQAADAVSQAWQEEPDSRDLSERVARLLKMLTRSARERLFPRVNQQVKRQADKLDGVLSDRYGHRYQNFKDQFEVVRAWYVVPEETTLERDGDAQSTAIEVESEVVR